MAGLFSYAALLYVQHGFAYWVLVAISSWVGDTGALLVGRFCGRHKVAPRISPKKTWEGIAGSLVTSILTVQGCAALMEMHMSRQHVIAIGFLSSAASVLGDLFESIIKRAARVSDSGSFFPGHGGMLDRLDSLLLAFPCVYAYAELLMN